MAPRNNDATTSCKKKSYPVEENNDDEQNILPNLLHKKHKVVKLVKCQIQKIQEEGLICASGGAEADDAELIGSKKPMRLMREGEEEDLNRKTTGPYFLSILFLLLVLLLVYLMVWISAGPLSNSSPRTPVLKGSFIQTEGLCSLEKKYLLRWGKPDYAE